MLFSSDRPGNFLLLSLKTVYQYLFTFTFASIFKPEDSKRQGYRLQAARLKVNSHTYRLQEVPILGNVNLGIPSDTRLTERTIRASVPPFNRFSASILGIRSPKQLRIVSGTKTVFSLENI